MAKPVKCGRCGRENDAAFTFCLDCGQSLRAASAAHPEPTCPACGAKLQAGFKFCGHCGRPVAGPAPPPPPSTPSPGAGPIAAGARPGRAPPPAAGSAQARGLRLQGVRNDGLPGSVFALDRPEVICGRTEGQVRFPEDPTISPRHVRFMVEAGGVRVEDLGSVNGTFVRIRNPRRLGVGDEIRIGRQLLRIEPLPRPPSIEEKGVRAWGGIDPGYRLRLTQLLDGGGVGEVFPLRPGENAVGRETGDVTFPSDRYVSSHHARLDVQDDDSVTVVDLGSSNGTFVKAIGPIDLGAGDELLVGSQLLRIEG